MAIGSPADFVTLKVLPPIASTLSIFPWMPVDFVSGNNVWQVISKEFKASDTEITSDSVASANEGWNVSSFFWQDMITVAMKTIEKNFFIKH